MLLSLRAVSVHITDMGLTCSEIPGFERIDSLHACILCCSVARPLSAVAFIIRLNGRMSKSLVDLS